MKSLRDKRRISKIKIQIICAVGVILLGLAVYMFVTQLRDYNKSSKLYKDTAIEFVSLKYDNESGKDIADAEQTDWKDLVDVNISELREKNKDIIGWIYFENVDISYPVLYSEDNSNYLRKSYTGETMSAGSIFMEKENARDFSDSHTIIYGHNMKDLSMFGKLKYYVRETDYIDGHEYFQIIKENEKFRYKIFSYKVVSDDSNVYTVYKVGGQDFSNFVKNSIQNESYLDSNVQVGDNDHLITLSTCVNDDRLVVTAVRCDECSVN